MSFSFEPTLTRFCIEISNRADFLALLDSESYATGNAAYKAGASTLADKLDKLPGVHHVEYCGHFGAAVLLSIETEDDGPDLRRRICRTIEEHLVWCRGLKLVPHVKKDRAGGMLATANNQ